MSKLNFLIMFAYGVSGMLFQFPETVWESLWAACAKDLCSQGSAPALRGRGTFSVPTSPGFSWTCALLWKGQKRTDFMPPWKTIYSFRVKQKTAKDKACLKSPPAGLLPMQPGYLPVFHCLFKVEEKHPWQPLSGMCWIPGETTAAQICSYNSMYRAKAPPKKQSPAGAEESRQMLDMSL